MISSGRFWGERPPSHHPLPGFSSGKAGKGKRSGGIKEPTKPTILDRSTVKQSNSYKEVNLRRKNDNEKAKRD